MKKVRVSRAATVLAVLAAAALNSGALEVTSGTPAATANGKAADIVFSDSIIVKNIAFEKNAVVMPVTEYKDRIYTDVRMLSKTLYGKLEACFSKNKCAYAGKSAAPKLSVLEVKQLKSKARVANVILSFDGDLAVTFGVIKKYSGEIWAAYPANFEITDTAFKDLVEKKVKEGFEGASRGDKKAVGAAVLKK